MYSQQVIKDFVNDDLKVFSNQDNVRSIPSVVDGLKEAQRKVIHGVKKYGNKAEKVSRLVAFCSLETNYKHGETSLADTIVGLAKNYTGSNNINLLEPLGQFGSILSPDNASVRYISTKKSDHFDKIINPVDDIILEHIEEENVTIEPKTYYPSIPLWLVNGAIGIGTGHSVKILNRDVENVKKVIHAYISGKDTSGLIDKLLLPSFNGFKGKVTQVDVGTYLIEGVYKIINTTTIHITELPIGYTHNKYKEVLIDLLEKNIIKDYESNSTEDGFMFEITCARELTKKSNQQLMKLFKLTKQVTENVTLFNEQNVLTKYNNVYDALVDFIKAKLASVERRKQKQLDILEEKVKACNYKIGFIELFLDIPQHELKKITSKQLIDLCVESGIPLEYAESYVKLPIYSLTVDKIKEIRQQGADLLKQMSALAKKDVKEIYLEDLD